MLQATELRSDFGAALLMTIGAEEADAGTPQNASHAFTKDVGEHKETDETEDEEESGLRSRRRKRGSAAPNLQGSQDHTQERNRDDGESQTSPGALATTGAADDFRSTPGADTRALGNTGLTVWTHRRLHPANIITARAGEDQLFAIQRLVFSITE